MTAKLIAVGVIAALVALGGEFIIRRDRKRTAARDALARDGIPTTGTVTSLTKVSAGKYGQFRWRAEITYPVGDADHITVESWAPEELPELAEGATFPVRYATDDPSRAMVIGAAAPSVPSAWVWRGLTLFVVALCIAALFVL